MKHRYEFNHAGQLIAPAELVGGGGAILAIRNTFTNAYPHARDGGVYLDWIEIDDASDITIHFKADRLYSGT